MSRINEALRLVHGKVPLPGLSKADDDDENDDDEDRGDEEGDNLAKSREALRLVTRDVHATTFRLGAVTYVRRPHEESSVADGPLRWGRNPHRE